MEILFLIILGVVQGLTEFLPVSSSGHLVLLSRWLGIGDSLFVSIILHLATLLSIIVVLRKEVWQFVRHPFSNSSMKLYVATIPTCIIVLILMPLVNKAFGGAHLWLFFLISALLLFISDKFSKKNSGEELNFRQALIMGIAQGFAVFPGVSRSGTTISAGLIAGADKEKTAKFSFIMSIPIILLSLVMEIVKIAVLGEAIEVSVTGIVLAFVLAFIVGVLSIKIMLKLTQKARLKWFSVYLVVISIISMVF